MSLSSADHPALRRMLERRSTSTLVGPEPTPAEIELILRAATTAPDHGQLRPYRFLVVRGEGRRAFGDALAAAAQEARADISPAMVDKVRNKAFAAPALIALVAKPSPGKIPAWEQIATASCAGFAMVLAADALGLGAIWKSTPFPEGTELRARLGMAPDDRLLGWINLGHPAEEQTRTLRPEVDLAAYVSLVGASGIQPYPSREVAAR